MKLPYMKAWDNTPFLVKVTDGIDENGSPQVVAIYDGMCNYREKSKMVRDADGQLIQLNAVLITGNDIAPNTPIIEGNVSIAGREWKIYSASRPRNPDGTVHHTMLELI